MNHVYRIVFNRALGVLQVVSELAGGAQGGAGGSARRAPQRRPLARACAWLLAGGLAGIPMSAMARQDFVIAASGGDATGASLTSALGSGNVTVLSSSGANAGSGNIVVNDALAWSSNTLTLTAADDININAAVTVSGSAGLALNPSTGNGADGAVAGGTTTIASTGSLSLAGSGTNALGSLTDNGSLDISGLASGLTITSLAGNGTVNLGSRTLTFGNAAGTFSGVIGGTGGLTLTGGTETLTGANTYSGGTTLIGGTLSISSDANLGATSGGVILDGATLHTTGGLTLDHALTVGAGGGTLQTDANLTVAQAITGAGSLTQGGSGTLTLAANVTTGGSQTYNGTLALGTDATLTSTGAGGITVSTLDGAHAATFNTSGTTTLGNIGQATALTSLATNAGGNTLLQGNVTTLVAQTYNDAVTLGADVILASTAAGNIDFASTIDGARAVQVNTAGTTLLGNIGQTIALTSLATDAGGNTVLDGDITTTGAQTYNDAVTLGANDVLTSTGNGNIRFNNTLDGGFTLDVNTGGAVDFSSAVGSLSALSGLAVDSGTFSAGALNISGGLSITTRAGGISQAGAFRVQGTSSFDAGTNAITLNNAGNDFIGAVSLAGGDTLITDVNALTLGTLDTGSLTAVSQGALSLGGGTVGRNLRVTSNGGAISQTGALNVADVTTIDAGSGAITLNNAGNDFTGIVNVTGGTTAITDSNAMLFGSLATGSLAANSGGRLGLGDGSINGNLSATSFGDMVQRGALTVTGISTLAAGPGSILLSDAGNDFVDAVSASAGGGVSISDANDLTISALSSGINGPVSLIAGGTLTLPVGAIDTGTGDLTLASNGGSLATTDALTGNHVSLTGRDGLTLGSDVTGAAVTLDTTNAQIAQTGGGLTAGTLAGSSGTGNVTLTNAANFVGTLGDFSAGNFSLVDNQRLTISGNLDAGGDITLVDALGIDVTGSIAAGGSTTIASGTAVNIGIGGVTGSISGDVIDDGALEFNSSDAVTFADTISGSGALVMSGSGTLALDGNSSAFTGTTLVDNGTLLVGSVAGNGADLGGDVAVASGATLGGHGTIGGNVDIAGGAHLAPGTGIGTLGIGGDLTLAQNAQLDYEFGAPGADFSTPGSGDSVVVGGNLTLDGAALNVTNAGGMGPGLYSLFSYSGTLTETNGGIGFGTVPAGQTLSLQVLTTDKQINLIDSAGLTLNFWNGNGLATATSMGGGGGTWSTTSMNWTDASASVTAAMQPQPGFAIFGGAAGTVTVDNTDGAVSATGLQFASDAYTLRGDTLTLVGNGTDAPGIRVGDGSSAGAGYTATIDNVLAGSDGIAKTDAGTLVLTADNVFSGGVAIDGGALSVSRDANLGDAGNALTLDGGLLQVTGTAFTGTTRDIVFGSNGGGFDIADAGNVFTVQQQLDGSGAFVKAGAGTLVLGADNTFSGDTTIGAGTLQLGTGGTTGSIVGNVVDNGVLAVDRSDDVTFAGVVSGTGALHQLGAGTLVLTAGNSFSGGTVIGSGTLQLGDGGTSGMITGNVVDNGALAFDRSDDIAFAGAISGSGALLQQGGGKLVLDGDSSAFAGSTDVQSGTLQVGSVAGNGAVLGGDVEVAAGATLGGLGTIGGDVVNSGTVAPGAGIGALTIAGDYTQTADGRLQIDVQADGQADQLLVGGNATLDGSTLVLAANGAWQPRTDYTILTAGGTVSGTFATATSSLLFLDPVLSYDAHDVYLSLQRNDVQFADAGLTPNQRATATAADTLGFGSAVYDALTLLDATTAPPAFDALSGEVHASVQASLVEDSRYLRLAMRDRLDTARADGLWATGWGHWAHDDSDGNAAELRTDGRGVAAGGDIAVGDDARIGVLIGNSRTSAQVDDRASHADIDSRHLGAYGRLEAGVVQLQAGVARSWHDIDSRRDVVFPGFDEQLRGNRHASTTQAYIDASHAFSVAGGTLSPFVDLARVEVRGDGFTETGGAAALQVDPMHTSRSFATAGVRAAFALDSAWRLQGSLAWSHAFGGDANPQVREAFVAGSDPFVISGVPIADNALSVQAGLGYQATATFRVDASYIGRFASDARDQGARLTLAWSF